MKFRRTTGVAFLAATLFGTVASARPLENELREVLAEHPLLKSFRKSVEASDKGRNVASAAFFPQITISGDAGKEKIANPGIETDMNRRRFTATIEQNLYAGGRHDAGYDIADTEFAAQTATLSATTQDVLREAITAYLQVARYQTLIAIARRNEETTMSQLALENERVERGGGIAVDVLQARTRLQLVKERRVFYEQGLRDATANYHQVFGHAPELSRMQALGVFAEHMPASLEAALDQGREHNPRLKEAFLQSKKAQKQVAVERSGMLPTIDLVGTDTSDTRANALTARDETSVLLRFSWNVFNGRETSNRTKAAALQHEALLDREVATINKSDETIRVAWNQLINGGEREGLLESAAAISYDVMQNRKRLRDAGKETAINVLDAEVEYYGVMSNQVNARYDTVIGSYRLLAATGMLTPATLGITDGKFSLPVKALSLDAEKLDAYNNGPIDRSFK